MVYHPPANLPQRTGRGRRWVQNTTPGFPDLTLMRAPELVFAELKTETGRVRPEQVRWIEELTKCGLRAFVWRPSDFDRVVDVLAR